MNLRVALMSLLASTVMCAAPALAKGNGIGQHIGHVFITPVLCDTNAQVYEEGAFTEWVHTHSHFIGLKVGMTNPGDHGNTVGVRLDGGIQGIPFGPVGNWTMTFTEGNTSCADNTFSVVFNIPGEGVLVLGGNGDDNGLHTVSNGDGSFTTTSNYSSMNFPTGTTFIGIYMNNFDDSECAFNTTVTFASVDNVPAVPNMHTGGRATNGFVADCNGDVLTD